MTPMVDRESHNRQGAFFGRRKGHALKPRQAALFDTLLPKLALDLGSPAPADLRSLFDDAHEVRLESGFGGGEHLIAEAASHPDTGFIGIEPFINGMAKALAAIDDRKLNNIRLHHGDATDMLAWLPAAGLGRFDLLYPDPWPKRRHWKRRFVQDKSVAAIARSLRPGGEFRFASDIPGYIEWTLARLSRSPDFVWTAEQADDWRKPWPGFTRTRYEAKAVREGRTPCYLVFRRR
ncbi:MAG: tRNA (guanosine(46)-N7)-methyltransferase TrmB [Xanthobacteraceae bacterium]|nr:tRNA (guanosine(46)-N7)-methyltransferase TrmB [Xanthobacteraceae bacterium]